MGNDWKAASTTDRKLIREERGAMETIATEKKTLMTAISVSVENMADNIFATVQGDRQKIADNFLSLKAYAQAAADKVTDYVQKGKGKNLSSVGDLLTTLAGTYGQSAKP